MTPSHLYSDLQHLSFQMNLWWKCRNWASEVYSFCQCPRSISSLLLGSEAPALKDCGKRSCYLYIFTQKPSRQEPTPAVAGGSTEQLSKGIHGERVYKGLLMPPNPLIWVKSQQLLRISRIKMLVFSCKLFNAGGVGNCPLEQTLFKLPDFSWRLKSTKLLQPNQKSLSPVPGSWAS